VPSGIKLESISVGAIEINSSRFSKNNFQNKLKPTIDFRP
jgi:hypothetical protein